MMCDCRVSTLTGWKLLEEMTDDSIVCWLAPVGHSGTGPPRRYVHLHFYNAAHRTMVC